MTAGAMAMTRLSTAAVVHVVQPRLDAPETTNRATFCPPPSGAAANCGDRVHRAHRALGHRQARRPFLVAGAQELVPGVGDEVVLGARLLRGVVHEHDRLIRHQPQLRGDRAGIPRRADEPCRRLDGGWRSRLPPVMKSSATSLVTFSGRITVSQCVHSGRSHLGFGQPLLRGHLEQRGRDAFRRERLQAPSRKNWHPAPRHSGRAPSAAVARGCGC